MTTREVIRAEAAAHGWTSELTWPKSDHFVKGDRWIRVHYSKAGHVASAISDRAVTGRRNKRRYVLAWLTEEN